MRALERRGLRNLTREPKPRPRTANCRVRIYYRNADDELLCCDSDPLTRQSAQKLLDEMKKGITDCEHAYIVPASGRHRWTTRPQNGARWVELPHQVPEGIEQPRTFEQLAEAAGVR